MRAITRTAIITLALALTVGCVRGPDEATLRHEVQTKLTSQVKDGLLEVIALTRRGSAPLAASDGGSQRLVVYYNATLRFRQDYDFGGWEKLSPASLGYVLGATEKGLFGIKPQNRTGDLLYVYGSTTFESAAGQWKNVAATPGTVTTPADPGNAAPPSRSKQLIDRLAAMVDVPPPGPDPAREAVILDELNRATENIQRRLTRRGHVYTVASGPRGGEYARFATSFVESIANLRPDVSFRALETDGSVQNAWLLARGEADYAIIQSDVAAQAVAGHGPFAKGGPLTTLRALGSLFPEAVHVVVPASSSIRTVEALRGKRVDIGAPQSGTQYSAILVLAAHGLDVRDLREVSQEGGERAARRLSADQVDALFVTIAAPARSLQELAARPGIRLVTLSSRGIHRIVGENLGLVAMTLPPNSYPGQGEPVATVATTALLVGTSDEPDAEVEKVVSAAFARADGTGAARAEAIKVSRDNALRGITIPLHPGATRFFASRP